MNKERIVGRTEEMAVLDLARRSPDPEFIAIYGRRRVGKTYLVREFFGDAIGFEITGLHDGSLEDQLGNFAQALGKALGLGVILPQKPASWMEAFRQLEQFCETSLKQETGHKRVIFLDELPWLNTPRSGFLSGLEHFWNSYASRQPNLILVVCGSAASWMIQNIVQARGGLHNRITRRIRLLPFTLGETEAFLRSRGIQLTRFQLVELYMAIGGIPHYLKEAEPGLSAAQLIDRICFSEQGLLRDEFQKLYASLFDNPDQHVRIVKALAAKRRGLSRKEILDRVGLPSGGSASQLLEELEESGFVQSQVPFGKKSNEALYRLADEFSQFHLDWIAPLGKRSPGAGYWLTLQNAPRRRAWAGYTFEGICLKHIARLKAALGISGVETTEAPWYHRAAKESEPPGVQIDLLLDRRDQTINLCEIKFSEAEFVIDARYAQELRRKVEVFRHETGTRKNVFLTMLTTFGVTNNEYARELVAKSLTLEALF